MRSEAVQPLLEGALAPRGLDGNPQCHDCASAGTLCRFNKALTWDMARTAVSNDRQEQYRLPGVMMGMVKLGLAKPSKPGDLDRQIKWLKKVGIFGDDQ